MSNLDNFFKHKTGGEPAADFEARHPFREEYWLAAEKLIEAEERRRRFFWWLAAAGLAALLAGSWCFLKKTEAQTLGQTDIAQQVETGFTGDKSTAAGPKNEQQISPQYQDFNPTDPNPIDRSINNQPTNPEVISKNSSLIVVHDIRKVGGGADASSVSRQTNGAARRTMDGGWRTAQDFDPPSTGSIEIRQPSAVSRPSLAVDLLPFQLKFIDLEKNDNMKMARLEVRSEGFSETAKFKNPSDWSFGLVGGGFWMPENLGKKDQVGGSAGVFVEKKLTQKWSAFSEIRARFRPDGQPDILKNQTSEQRRYSFGFEKDTFSLARKSAFWLEIPLGLRFSKNRASTEFGIAPAFLTGTRGVLESFSSNSFQNEPQKLISKQVWMADENYRKSYFSLFAGTSFQVGRSFVATLRANYLPKNLGINSEASCFSTSKLSLELGVKINLK